MQFHKTILPILVITAALLIPSGFVSASTPDQANTWVSKDEKGNIQIHLYFFWSKKCPHCLMATPFIELLEDEYNWLVVHSLELTEHPENAMKYRQMASYLLQKARSVPGFLFCETMMVGYDSGGTMAEALENDLKSCHKTITSGGTLKDFREIHQLEEAERVSIPIPFIGTLELQDFSLPVMTMIIAAMDAFNPCAFFVLLFLLSMMVHAQSRIRIFLVGAVFVFISGFMYFLFMAAWLNVFLIMGQLKWITLAAGLLAVTISLINIKDYFWFKQGVSLTIPDGAKPGLFQRMRGLLDQRNLATMMAGAAALAIFANLYEFLCTAGFPMVFTRILTLEKIPQFQYYLYLVFYNLVYVIPLAFVVIVFTVTLGKRKLQEHEGRVMKLLSGLMMFSLGGILLVAPQLLNHLLTAFAVLLFSITGTIVITLARKKLSERSSNKMA
jgi:thiol-disulfide isomerase/thioredoxin